MTCDLPSGPGSSALFCSEPLIIPDSVIKQIGCFMADLFDFNYYRRSSTLLFDELKSLTTRTKQNEVLKELDTLKLFDAKDFLLVVKDLAGLDWTKEEIKYAEQSEMRENLDIIRKKLIRVEKTLKPSDADTAEFWEDKYESIENAVTADFEDVCKHHIRFMGLAFRYLFSLKGSVLDKIIGHCFQKMTELEGWKNVVIDSSRDVVEKIGVDIKGDIEQPGI